jgi:hypothetical protein
VRLGTEAGPDGVLQHIRAGVLEVLVVLDQEGVEARLKQVPGPAVPVVERLGVDAVEAVHDARNRLHRALDDDVEVVRHQAVHVDLQPRLSHEQA